MSFSRRITLASAAAVAVAVLLASVLVYLLTSGEVHGQVDAQLRSRSDNLRLIEHRPVAPATPAAGRLGRSLLDARLESGQRATRWATSRPGPTRCAAISSSSTPAAGCCFAPAPKP